MAQQNEHLEAVWGLWSLSELDTGQSRHWVNGKEFDVESLKVEIRIPKSKERHKLTWCQPWPENLKMFKCSMRWRDFRGIPKFCSKIRTKEGALGLWATRVPFRVVYYHCSQWTRNKWFQSNDTLVAWKS